jgi:predicted secreted protein
MKFNDVRGKRIVLVPHCVLNQNARVAGAAVRPAAMEELIAGLLRQNLGILQMPCPELVLLGLDRAHVPIRSRLEDQAGRAHLQDMARDLVGQIESYRKCGVEVLAILGKNGSPTCGVETTWRGGVVPGMGVFTEELRSILCESGLDIRILGIEDADPAAVMQEIMEVRAK